MTTLEIIPEKAEYTFTLKTIDELIAGDDEKGTTIYDELDVINTLASHYEDIHYPIEFRTIVKA